MREESAVLGQIREWARVLETVRAVIVTSSRADPRRKPDLLSDYDVQVFVRDTETIARDDTWLHPFGSVMVRWPLRPQHTFSPAWITQLVVFDDGVRIDFQFTAGEERLADVHDPYFLVVLDKEGMTRLWTPPACRPHEIAQPTSEAFRESVNDFWWDIVYVAKGLWRGELSYARSMLDGSIRIESLARLLEWYVGATAGWDTQIGVHGRWLHRALDGPTWAEYLRTFGDSSLDNCWSALFATMELARKLGRVVAESLGYEYPQRVDLGVSSFIQTLAPVARPPP